MIHVVLLLCALSAPSVCREEPVLMLDAALPSACLMAGQVAAVEYVAAHPGWALRAVECRRG